ncbi:site-specific integrase [Pseudomonas sp. PH1b]|uniref:site-specific integrase n=1 Tax=Pseudomonas sp. PH1b TaxID=1397282 RepID=UPI0009DCB9F7|nr:site-specific integrase [Pseudomonas sp. PH1b]
MKQDLDEYVLIKFRMFLEDYGLSGAAVASLLSSLRKFLDFLIAEKYVSINEYLDTSIGTVRRETGAMLPYDFDEMRQIESGLDIEIKNIRKAMLPYKKTGLGAPPENRNSEGKRRAVMNGHWRDENNLRWYFENILNCEAIPNVPEMRQHHDRFFSAAQAFHGGHNNLYRKWGVVSRVTPSTVFPYLFKLVSVTGLNTSVALTLQVDSYQEEHPLTGRPYLRYSKPRGSGESELHLGLLQSDIMALDGYQNKVIKEVWGELLDITSRFRDTLPVASKNLLFVCQNRGGRFKVAKDFTSSQYFGRWAGEFSRRHNIISRTGDILRVTLPRFRPSLVSQLIKNGVDIYVIKDILGHSNVVTTFRYIDSYDFNPVARKEIKSALNRIRQNALEYDANPKEVANENSNSTLNKLVYSTPLSLCKNVYSPPNNIRLAAGIAEGSPCTIFNMCLRCPNVLILQEHLPSLFSLRAQYLVAFEQGVSAVPHRAILQQNLHILNNLLDSETSDWPDDVLAKAEAASLKIENVVDTIIFRAVM